MEQCMECKDLLTHRKTLGRHVKYVHKMSYVDYLAKHGKSERCVCPCGVEFENTRYPGGPRAHGRRQVYCSPECTHKATNVRAYGLTLDDYYKMLTDQGFCCAICKKHVDEEKSERFFAVDHEHVPGYFQLPPEEKRKYVRGLLCVLCNKHRMAGVDIQIVKRMLAYLEDFELRRSSSLTPST